jgi:hypothetical protein
VRDLILFGRRGRLRRLGGFMWELGRQFVAEFNGEPVSRVILTDRGTIKDDRVHSFHMVAKTEVVAAIPERVRKPIICRPLFWNTMRSSRIYIHVELDHRSQAVPPFVSGCFPRSLSGDQRLTKLEILERVSTLTFARVLHRGPRHCDCSTYIN